MHDLSTSFSLVSWTLLFILIVKMILFLSFASVHLIKSNKSSRKRIGKYRPKVSVLVPCFNEELTLANCVVSLLKQSYTNIEIILIDDGSKDNTKRIGRELEKAHKKVLFLSKINGGKASALNYGLFRCNGEIVICMDADSMFTKDTIRQLVLSFYNDRVVAVGGNVKVANRNNYLGKLQAIEYITGLTLQRRSFAYINCMQVISGAVGAFKKKELIEVGGYSEDTIVEDMDVTITLAKAGHQISYNGNAIAYTEAPESVSDFLKQRYRWTFGGFQVISKHKSMLFNPKYKQMGLIGMPYFAFFPWIDVLISLLFMAAIVRVSINGNILDLLFFFILMSSIQGLLIFYSMFIDKEQKRLTFFSGSDSLWYSHLISYITIKAGINFLRGSKTSWNKLTRLGKNFAPTS